MEDNNQSENINDNNTKSDIDNVIIDNVIVDPSNNINNDELDYDIENQEQLKKKVEQMYQEKYQKQVMFLNIRKQKK